MTDQDIARYLRRHYRKRIRRAGYFNAGPRRYRSRFVRGEYYSGRARGPHSVVGQDMEYEAQLSAYLYGWFRLASLPR